ncbi:sensor histidine kinase [Methanobacterium sp. SMA-27]|uniref:sensor histidine kinase n=1 Tax=Methanobacterium sp. SMA-27 TaxID=1495336 RepID=UPI0006941DE4|nr:sensor histidine kinase [Methanobacterium sp. SMA-27]
MVGGSDLIERFRYFPELSSILIVIAGFLVLLGWAFDISILKSPGTGFSTIKTNTAVALIFFGVSLWLLQTNRTNGSMRSIAQISAIIVTLIGILTLIEYLFAINLGIDQILFKELPGALYASSPNRMALAVAVAFILIGPSLLFLSKNTPKTVNGSQIMALIVVFVVALPLIGFLYGASQLYYIPNFTGVAIYAVLLLLWASLSILFARPDQGFVSNLTSNQLGSYFAQRILPILIIFTIIIGFITYLGGKVGLYDNSFGLSILILSTLLVYTIIFLWFAIKLNKTDFERDKAEEHLKENLDNLEITVKKRTNELTNANVLLNEEIEERKTMEKEIKTSLEEKEMLLKEIHHRVKNNLMIISSLLNLQSSYIKDKESQDIFKESQNRARSMALIHERLYQSTDLKRINFGDYITSLANELFHTYIADPNLIELKINVDDIFLDINTAIPLGLIVNELITNSLKYAFSDGMDGEIVIDFNSLDEHYEFAVIDNGIGFPEDLDYKNTDTLGLQIVNSLTDQIDGEIKLDRNNGTEFKITFKDLDYNG